MTSEIGLDGEAVRFAVELTATVQLLVPDCAEFIVDASNARHSTERVSVRQDPDTGIDGEPLINLKVSYLCSLDRAQRYLAVERSDIVMRATGDSKPLMRFDYLRNPKSADIPRRIYRLTRSAAFGYVMAKAGNGTRRGRRRVASTGIPRLSEVHLPVGGPRFRPCLEDVLEILVVEFGVDHTADGLEALRKGREVWRKKQIATVVRDSPDTAADALRQLGYVVDRPEGVSPADDTHRLRAL